MININLTNREYQVLLILIKGYQNKDIAKHLNVKTRTIETHVRNILFKTDSTNRGQIISKYFDNIYNFNYYVDKTSLKYVKIINLFKLDKLTLQEIADRVNTSYNYTNSVIVKFRQGKIKL